MIRSSLLVLLLALAPEAIAQDLTVRVEGFAADRERLEGVWEGGYACEATGRHGTLTFTLAPGASHAIARLVMVPRATPEAPDPEPIVLAFHIVEVDSATVRGALAPYADPEWDLPLETHFVGTLGDGRLDGTFDSLPTTVDSLPASGVWWAVRTRSASSDL
ncbi:MAG: hypothetical protein AAFQ43_00370 [Bacteroidota bacterium]